MSRETTPLAGKSKLSSSYSGAGGGGSVPEYLDAVSESTESLSAHGGNGTQGPIGFFVDNAQTELSFDEMRGSLLEGCCPADSVASGALSLLTSAVTPTLLSLPLAFSVSGSAFAMFMIGICVLMTLASVRILAFASASAHSDDYEVVAGFFFGNACRYLTRGILFFYNFGCSVVYLRFIFESATPVVDMFRHSLPSWLAVDHAVVLVLVLFVACATPLSFNSRLASLRTKGLVSNVLVTFIVATVIFRYFYPVVAALPGVKPHRTSSDATEHTSRAAKSGGVGGLLGQVSLVPYMFAGPIFVFAYEIQSNVMGVFRDLADPTPPRILMCVSLALVGATIFYTLIGLFGAWSFPDSVNGNVLNNYSLTNDPLMLISQLCCCVSAAVAFVFVLFPCRFAFFMLISDGTSHRVPKRFRVRIGIFLSVVSCLLALYVPDVALAVSVLGASCSSTLSMTLPAFLSMSMRRSGTYCTSLGDTVLSYAMLAGGLSFAVCGTFASVYLGV